MIGVYLLRPEFRETYYVESSGEIDKLKNI